MIPLFFLIFAITCVLSLSPIRGVKAKMLFFLLLWFVMVCYAAFRDGAKVGDYVTYVQMFKDVNNGFTTLTEPSFVYLSQFVGAFSNDAIYVFVVYALIGVSLKFIAIRRLTELWFLSLVVYLSNFFILHELTQMRAGVAAGFLLLCIKPIYDRDWKRFLLLSTCAILFHYSALVILPLWILGHKQRKIWLFVSIPIAYIIYFSGVNLTGTIPIPVIKAKLELYQRAQEYGTENWSAINVFNLVFICKILIFYILLWKYELIACRNKYAIVLMKVYCISLMAFPIFATMPVVGFRVSELYGIVEIILIPLLYYVFTPRIASIFIVILAAAAVAFVSVFYSKLIIN